MRSLHLSIQGFNMTRSEAQIPLKMLANQGCAERLWRSVNIIMRKVTRSREEKLKILSVVHGGKIQSTKDLTYAEALALVRIAYLNDPKEVDPELLDYLKGLNCD